MNLLKLSSKKFIRITAAFLAALLCYESAATPIAQAAMISQPAPIRNASTNSSSASQQISHHAASFNESFRVPASIGSTVEVFAPAKAGRLIYHLQDVHNNVAAQTNLSEIVSLLESHAGKQNRNLVIAVEGVSGPVDSDSISSLPNQKLKEDIGSGLLRAGYMLGEEYAAITHAPGRIKLVGIETPGLYGANVAARRLSRSARNSVLSTLRETHWQLSKLIPHNFNSILSQLEQKRVAVEDGRLTLTDYAAFLQKTNEKIVARYPNLAKMVALSDREAGIDFDKVEKEGKLLVQELMVNKSEAEVNTMLADARALKEGRLSPLSYYSILLGQTKRDYPLVRQYVSYLRASESIDAERLFDEVLAAESEIAKTLIRHPIALQLYEHIRWIEQQERFFSLNMIPQEWADQKRHDVRSIVSRYTAIRAFIAEQVGDLGYNFSAPSLGRQTLYAAYSGARGFYLAAEARDQAMVKNLQTVVNSTDKDNSVVAFIAGGFHTPGMTRLLRNAGFAYEVIRPQLETEVELSGQVNFKAKKVDYLRAPEGIVSSPDINAGLKGEISPEELQRKLDKQKPEGGNGFDGSKPLTLVGILAVGLIGFNDPSIVAFRDLLYFVTFVSGLAIGIAFRNQILSLINKSISDMTFFDTRDLSAEQKEAVFARANELNIGRPSDIFYMMQMLRQYIFESGKPNLPLPAATQSYPNGAQSSNATIAAAEQKSPAVEQKVNESVAAKATDANQLKIRIKSAGADNDGNFLPDSLMTPDERKNLMGIIDYKDIISANAKPIQVINIIINPLDGGLGENFGRTIYLKAYMPDGVKLGAKATDLRIAVEVLNPATGESEIHQLTIAEVKLLQIIQQRQQNNGEVSKVLYQPAVSDDSKPSYEKLLSQPFFLDLINPSTSAKPRTYAQALKDNRIDFSGYYVQQRIPGIAVETGNFGAPGTKALLQVAGHAQIGFHFFFEALRKAKEGLFKAGEAVVRVFMNGDNPNSRVDRKIIDHMVANNHVIYMLVTPAQPIDKKGGKLGVRFTQVGGKEVAVPDMMEVKQAKNAGQEEDFYALGQDGGIGDPGKQSFNTNIIYINENLLGDILKDLEKVLGGSAYVLTRAFAATRIDKDAKEVDGKKFIPVDGAIGSALLNLNAFFLTTENAEVKRILSDRGIDRLLHLINVPRVEFFTPNKTPSDHYLYENSDRFKYNPKTLSFEDTNPTAQQPELVLTAKDAKGKDTGFWNDLQGLIDNLGKKLGARNLKSLKIDGQVILPNAQLEGDVEIVSKVSADNGAISLGVQLKANGYSDLFNKDGRLVLKDVKVIIHEDFSTEVLKINTKEKAQSFSSKFPLLIGSGFAAGTVIALAVAGKSTGAFTWNAVSIALLAFTVLSLISGIALEWLRVNAPKVAEGTSIESLKEDPRFNPDLVDNIIKFAAANKIKEIKIVNGILADVNKETGVLKVGPAVLKSRFLQVLVLSHEQAHLSLPQFPATNFWSIYLWNEPIAYFLGTPWYFLNFVLFGLPTPAATLKNIPPLANGVRKSSVELTEKQEEFVRDYRALLKKYQTAQLDVPGNTLVDANETLADNSSGFKSLVFGLRQTIAATNGEMNVVVYSRDGDTALVNAFEKAPSDVLRNYPNPKPMRFYTTAETGKKVLQALRSVSFISANVNESNAYVVGAPRVDYEEATAVYEAGSTPLSMAIRTFTASMYKKGQAEAVARELEALILSKFPKAGTLSEDVINEMIAAIMV